MLRTSILPSPRWGDFSPSLGILIRAQNKTPQTRLSHGTYVDQPSPESCSSTGYFLAANKGILRSAVTTELWPWPRASLRPMLGLIEWRPNESHCARLTEKRSSPCRCASIPITTRSRSSLRTGRGWLWTWCQRSGCGRSTSVWEARKTGSLGPIQRGHRQQGNCDGD